MDYFPVREPIGVFTIKEMVERSARLYGDRTALKIKRNNNYVVYTYRELLENVKKVAKALQSYGVKKGTKIAIIGENRPEWAISYLGVQYTAGICVPLDPHLKEGELKHIISDSGARGVISSGKYIDIILEATAGLGLKFIVSMDQGREGVIGWDEFLTKGEKFKKYKEISPELDDLAVLIYTSGTTGSSKGVMLSHRNIMSNVNSLYQTIVITEEDSVISILPLHHTFEATAGFLVPLTNGATIVYSPGLKSRDIIETMKENNITMMLGVPLLFEKIVEGLIRKVESAGFLKKIFFKSSMGLTKLSKGLGKHLFKSVREALGMKHIKYVISGGAGLPEWVSDFMERLGIPILQGYGLTEASPVVTVNPPQNPKNASIGIPIPDVEVKIDNPNEEGVGELLVRGPNVMMGYYKKPDETKKVLKNGWLYTGDLAKIDKDGYIYIKGRKKSIIVTHAGKNVYPEEVESKLSESPYIKEVLVVGRVNPDTKREEVYAIIHPDYERIEEDFKEVDENKIIEILKKEVKEYCSQLADYKRVKKFEIREEEFPKTTTKKIKRYLFQKKPVEV